MGTWGPGILQDDVAADVQVMFDDALASGMSVEQASREVLRELPGEMITDDDDGPVIMLALAALQLQHQALDPYVRDQALATIASGAAMDRWQAASPPVADGACAHYRAIRGRSAPGRMRLCRSPAHDRSRRGAYLLTKSRHCT